jgi:hypothetical protein
MKSYLVPSISTSTAIQISKIGTSEWNYYTLIPKVSSISSYLPRVPCNSSNCNNCLVLAKCTYSMKCSAIPLTTSASTGTPGPFLKSSSATLPTIPYYS